MRPKKIYLNYEENSTSKELRDNATWSEQPVAVTDCNMVNAEYTDLSQVWHSNEEQPRDGENLLVACAMSSTFGWSTMQMWYSKEEDLLHFPTEAHIDCPPFKLSEIKSWAYIRDLMRTPSRELDVKPFGAPDL